MFDVVMFLIENYAELGIKATQDKEATTAELEKIGFHKIEIDRALDWLDGLEKIQQTQMTAEQSKNAYRHYLLHEHDHISTEGVGFLTHLEQLNILDPMTREVVIDRLMALEKHEVDIARIQWVTLVSLFNQPAKKNALSILQDLILSDAFGREH